MPGEARCGAEHTLPDFCTETPDALHLPLCYGASSLGCKVSCLPCTVRARNTLRRQDSPKQKGLCILAQFPTHSSDRPQLLRREGDETTNRYSEVMGQEATAFSQDRLTTLSPKPCVTAPAHPWGPRSQRYGSPAKNRNATVQLPGSRVNCASGSQWMLGKLCPLLGPLQADIYNQDGTHPAAVPWRAGLFSSG